MATPSLLPKFDISYQAKLTQQSIQKIIIPHNKKQTVIPVEDIIFVEGEGNYSFLHTKDGKRFLISKTLKCFELMLGTTSFMRIHKSSIVNIHYLKEISIEADRYVRLSSGVEVAISRRKVREVYQALAFLV